MRLIDEIKIRAGGQGSGRRPSTSLGSVFELHPILEKHGYTGPHPDGLYKHSDMGNIHLRPGGKWKHDATDEHGGSNGTGANSLSSHLNFLKHMRTVPPLEPGELY